MVVAFFDLQNALSGQKRALTPIVNRLFVHRRQFIREKLPDIDPFHSILPIILRFPSNV